MSKKQETEGVPVPNKELWALIEAGIKPSGRAMKWLKMASAPSLDERTKQKYEDRAEYELVRERDWRLIIFIVSVAVSLALGITFLVAQNAWLWAVLIGHGIIP